MSHDFYMRYLSTFVFSLFLIGCGVDQSNPEQVALEYVEAVYYANLPRFKELVEEKHHQATDDYKLFVAKDSTAKSNTRKFRGDIQDMSIVNNYVKDGRATVRVLVHFKNGDRKQLSIRMHQVEDNWYVNPMSWSSW